MAASDKMLARWPAERVAILLGLRSPGLTASQIARQLGVTKNMVIGKLWRLDRKTMGKGTRRR